MNSSIKLSSPGTREFWEIPVLHEDEHLLALDKPASLLTAPDRTQPERASLMALLHAGIQRGAAWTRLGNRNFLAQTHRLDAEASGVILLAKSKPVVVALMNHFGEEKPGRRFVALVQGTLATDEFKAEAKLAPHPTRTGMMHVSPSRGKKAVTMFAVRERFSGWTLLQCEPLTDRPHQIRVHLRRAGVPVAGDRLYGGSLLLLSRLKPDYRLKPNRTERPLISSAALHAEAFSVPHPVTGNTLTINAPWPKDLTVAVRYLRRYAAT